MDIMKRMDTSKDRLKNQSQRILSSELLDFYGDSAK